MNTPTSIKQIRAFIAYIETNGFTHPFTLIPYGDAIRNGVPFSITFQHEGNDWAVFDCIGDVSPWEYTALERAGIIDEQS